MFGSHAVARASVARPKSLEPLERQSAFGGVQRVEGAGTRSLTRSKVAKSVLHSQVNIGWLIIAPFPNISITYCRLCGWLLRAGWTAQELLSTFAEELGSVTLIPDATGGVFEVRVDDKLIWSRGKEGRFPEMKELKQLVRDAVAPSRDLGHVDAKESKA